MANQLRNVAIAMAAAGSILAQGLASAAGAVQHGVGADQAHVRPTTPALRSLVTRAAEASATFRRFVQIIDDSDTYVYLLEGDCGRGVRACFSGVSVSGPHRLMRVTVALDRVSDRDLMAMIGHELRHTIEAIEDPTVRSSDALFFFYQRIGHRGTASSRETAAAVDAGDAVGAEVRQFTRSTKPE
jgi:hypothetical protein